jgi:ankyrin repeat protein
MRHHPFIPCFCQGNQLLLLALAQPASFSTSIVPALIAAGADVNCLSSKGDRTPLMLAAEQGATTLVRTLIEAKADQTAMGSGKSTAVDLLLEAMKLEHGNVGHALRVSGVDINVRNGVLPQYTLNQYGSMGGVPDEGADTLRRYATTNV